MLSPPAHPYNLRVGLRNPRHRTPPRWRRISAAQLERRAAELRHRVEFGTERIERLTGREIVARISELHAMTQFSGAPLQLRG